jgi:hypothetical protein
MVVVWWWEVLVMWWRCWLIRREVVERQRWWRDRIVWRRWVGVGLLALFLLVKGINGVL